MAVPRNRMSNARKNSKRAHSAKQKKNPAKCSHCGSLIVSHRACAACGWYNQKDVLALKD